MAYLVQISAGTEIVLVSSGFVIRKVDNKSLKFVECIQRNTRVTDYSIVLVSELTRPDLLGTES